MEYTLKIFFKDGTRTELDFKTWVVLMIAVKDIHETFGEEISKYTIRINTKKGN